jgi:hypothetical protein
MNRLDLPCVDADTLSVFLGALVLASCSSKKLRRIIEAAKDSLRTEAMNRRVSELRGPKMRPGDADVYARAATLVELVLRQAAQRDAVAELNKEAERRAG